MKKNIDVGSIVKAKVGEMYENKREKRIRRISKYVVVCVQYVLEKKNLPVKFEYGHKIDISASLISYIYSKYDVLQDLDDTIYNLPKILLVEMLIIDGYPVYEGYYMFEKVFYLSIFYCLCFIKEI